MEAQKTGGKLSLLLTIMKPYIAMVALQFGYAGMYIITMVSFNQGMSHWVLVVYRHLAATLVIAPFALTLERKIRPKLTISVMWKILVLGLLEPVIDQNLYYVGMKYTSATFAAATANVLPALTFIMAIIFRRMRLLVLSSCLFLKLIRMEKIKIRQIHSQAKVIGTVITVTGAMVMTLYKGPIVDILWYSSGSSHHATTTSNDAKHHWVAGTLMLLGRTLGWSAFFILQSITVKEYPAEFSLTTLICFTGTVGGAVVAVIMEHDVGAWAIGFNLKLFAAGVVCSGIAYYMQGFVSKERGPVFVTAFSPLCIIITAVLGATVLGEQIHLGSLIGAIVIAIGLYSVVWGKAKDRASENAEAQELPIVVST
ncbi:hypothetical protein RJ640_016835 [Escallonia rubra]|uniref:WAT1-related protein n=1 Tax=Escallonia rubra TaxID=112253 RepID=A0AA88QVJ7_9ASTE|nr:hypothetical protein RJ640_016835 [Escallonia rubra]